MTKATIDIYFCNSHIEPDDIKNIEADDLYDAKTQVWNWIQGYMRNFENYAEVSFEIIYEENGEYVDGDSGVYYQGRFCVE